MKSITFFFLFAILMALTIRATPVEEFVEGDNDDTVAENKEATSLRGISRFLAQSSRPVVMTCDKYPRVCRVKGSPGPDCCKKTCVNVSTDRVNCGKCGKKCKYSEICCKGECVNPMSDKKHCGGCNNKCKKASSCVYGMCSYA